ncbi:Peroxide stress-activated histidine kinase mak1 [Fulvia fulva]|nr:Peroxide stress-activated histidine kinase mak1 [Fulvia fulva]KAK4614988.1 Peroxide stress-activated histidine kinase mak1 [Fulvia fulva]WPV20713.1 Peroxide stress-activated histidine kinase mak1 [Fulvia fulva]WPV34937.1 Peroxide stress-activated histidine kinase mak1 [Fulvia fulva]
MKSSATPPKDETSSTSADDSSEHETEETEPTPTGAPSRPSVSATQALSSTGRPLLVRSPPGRLSEISRSPETEGGQGNATDSSVEVELGPSDGTKHNERSGKAGASIRSSASKGKGIVQVPPHGDLEQIKAALNTKILSETRARRSYGSSSGARDEKKRVSPIKEEEGATPPRSIVGMFTGPQEPVRTASTVSTESTESNRTIRGSVPATPAGQPLRTPSYPFPYVPGTPRTWSNSFHQPFTALSPTVSNQTAGDGHTTPGRSSHGDIASGGSTPAANSALMPGIQHGSEDPRFPTPNLYDLVLHLNCEPGLEQWWATVTNILHDHFKAERATLVQPVDPTDIENVPWGQKATFSMFGQEEFVPHRTVLEQTYAAQVSGLRRPELVMREPSSEAVMDDTLQKLHPERLRPRLESRHSYAGHGREVRDVLSTLNEPSQRTRPGGPQRTVTHAAGVNTNRALPKRMSSVSSNRHGSLSDPDFSSVGINDGPHAEIFTNLRALDHESHPLIEPGGVNRVLDRGRIVTVTRDYVSDPKTHPASHSAPEASSSVFEQHRSTFLPESAAGIRRGYEEYEQHPASPWAQSPAPSPAIQSDEESNPFFTSDDAQVDDSFNDAASPKDYSQFGQVEAIGVDRASTVIHIPLVHPTLSQPMQSLRMTPQSKDKSNRLHRSNTVDLGRKAPIAVLSVLTSAVPYPTNLAQALKLLGPHLATSFATAQQFSATHVQNVNIRHRRTASGHNPTTAPMTIEPRGLEELAHAEVEQPPGSASGSITSPSEYSGRSRASPSGSFAGTPGWDPASHGWTASRSVAGTPALSGTEMVDNYFDAKKRPSHRSGSNASATQTPGKSSKSAGSNESKTAADDESKTPRSQRKLRINPNGKDGKDDKSPAQLPTRERSPPRSADGPSPSRPTMRPATSSFSQLEGSKQHSLLHSYGADILSSFGGFTPIDAPTPGFASTPGPGAHARKSSYPEDMPPPSERLLRTIIDSVPVQIFTAQPETGSLSWVNSKFLIYRGQEPREVLSDPWQAIHPDDRNDFLPAWHRSLRTNQQLQQKVRLQRFDGSYRWFYVRAAPLKDKRQKVVHWIGTMMDFHEQQLAEHNSARQQETAASEAKYRALANSSPQIVFAVNKIKGVTFCNTQWLHYSGQTESQALGVGFMDQVHPEDLAKCRLPTFDGETGQPTNVPTSLPPEPRRTVSQSNASSSGSSETERAFSSSDDSVVTSPIAQMPQRKLSELASTGILKVSRDADGRQSYSTEVRLKSKDGNFRWHLVRVLLADPLLDHDEGETWYGTCTDINDHKTLERDLKETMDEKSRFLSNMSHEIRTPLNGITGMVNFLIDSSLTVEQMEHVNIIRQSTEGLRGLINDILDLSKAEAGMIQLNMDWLYVRALIEEVNDLTSALAIDKGLELNYIVEEEVPPQVKGDRFRLRQILLNIVGNALKFTQQGEVLVRCCLQKDTCHDLDENELYIRFEVVDTGRGFTDREAEYLFKRFSQIDGSSTKQQGGTGLGLVISKQLAQLHGGDMGARGVPGSGSTFTFFIKGALPSREDRPPPPTPGPQGLPLPGPVASSVAPTALTKVPSLPSYTETLGKASPRFLQEVSGSPSPYSPDNGKDSPSVSSASSDPSVRSATRTGSVRSDRSSVSSIIPDPSVSSTSSLPMKLSLPEGGPTMVAKGHSPASTGSENSATSTETVRPTSAVVPPMFSILVIAPWKYSREATVRHIDMTLPKNIPHQITARESFADCQDMLGGEEPVIFTHIVVVLQDVNQILGLMRQIFSSPTSSTAMVLITDLAQRRKIMEQAPDYNYDQLVNDRRLRFVFKPLKPSRFGLIFDPQKEREMSLDRNQDSAQQVAVNQKQVFEELTKRLGNRANRVLLVEDNRVNQMVILKFLAKVSIKVDTVMDGVQCTDKVFDKPHGYYSIILCDLHMPNKDGYQSCKEIRKWERKNKFPHLPIIALSANVLGDVYQKCAEAGFNSYLTKPVDFKELSTVLMSFMDPQDPTKPHEFMKLKRGHVPTSMSSSAR